jgi:hypothetical protein
MPRRRIPTTPLALALALASGLAIAARPLPPPLSEWIGNEQGRISRSVDPTRITALTNHQDPRYAPESRQTFEVKSYWVDAEKMRSFAGEGMTADLRAVFTRSAGGREQVRLLVHPESEQLYRTFLAQSGAVAAPSFQATATASSRTLLVWPQGQPGKACFAKLSLDKEIGGVRRTVSQGEVARSVGINNVLQVAKQRGELPAGFKFIPEVFSAIPRGMSEGGMVVRQIPSEVLEGRVRYLPLFSLYAEPGGNSKPLLAEMISRSGQDAESFVREKIIRPFARQWIELSVLRGIAPQPHAQNLLLEVGRDGLPTGNFVHRDFGGFNLDFAFRRERALAMPGELPKITTVDKDYKNDRFGAPEHQVGKLDSFFYGGFVYNLDQSVPGWGRRGWVNASGVRSGDFKRMLCSELESQYGALTGRRVKLDNDLGNLARLLDARRATPAGASDAGRTRGGLRAVFSRLGEKPRMPFLRPSPARGR